MDQWIIESFEVNTVSLRIQTNTRPVEIVLCQNPNHPLSGVCFLLFRFFADIVSSCAQLVIKSVSVLVHVIIFGEISSSSIYFLCESFVTEGLRNH